MAPLPEKISDAQLIHNQAQRAEAIASSSQRSLKRRRLEVSKVDSPMEPSSSASQPKIVVRGPRKPRDQKEKPSTEGVKSPIPSSPAVVRAREMSSSLGIEHHSFIKLMIKSHVGSAFLMRLPSTFCKSFLPIEDANVVLEDEDGVQFDVKYIGNRNGQFSAGWRKFVDAHNLVEGDALIFSLVEPYKFKVHIIRVNAMHKVDGALSLPNSEVHAEGTTAGTRNGAEMVTPSPKTKRMKSRTSVPLASLKKKHKKLTPSSRSMPPQYHLENDNGEVSSEAVEALAEKISDAPLIHNQAQRPEANASSSQDTRGNLKRRRLEVSKVDSPMEPSSSQPKIIVRGPRKPRDQKETPSTEGVKSPTANSPAGVRAMEMSSSLGIEHHSFIKLMRKSHVGSCLMMFLPLTFCKSFQLIEDANMVLEDEDGVQFDIKYIGNKGGFSTGWKKFVDAHNLVEGDALIFSLVEPYKFKVYIIRVNAMHKVDGALGLPNSEVHAEETTPGTRNGAEMITPSPKTKRMKSQKLRKKKHTKLTPSRSMPPHSGEFGSEAVGGFKNLRFQEINSLDEFHIVVKGLCIDAEFSDDVRKDYYKLCLYKKEFLHPESASHKLVAGIIDETVRIANEMKSCKLTTTKEEFEKLDNSLKSFELLGMKVGFLRDHIHTRSTLAFEYQGYMEAKNKINRTEEEIKNLKAKLDGLKEASRCFEGVVGALKQKVDDYGQKLRKLVDAQW